MRKMQNAASTNQAIVRVMGRPDFPVSANTSVQEALESVGVSGTYTAFVKDDIAEPNDVLEAGDVLVVSTERVEGN